MTRRFMGLHRGWVFGAMLLGFFTPRVGLAEGGTTPLGELRVAAEALADVDPDLVLPPPRSRQAPPVLHDSTSASASDGTPDSRQNNSHKDSFRSEIKEAIHGAVRAEIAREAMGRPVLAQQRERSKGSAQSNDSAESGRGEAGASGKAALQAQQAHRNQAVSQAKKEGKGESLMNGKSMNPSPKDSSGKPQALR